MSHDKRSTEVERIADQLRRVYEGPSWLGPSVKELISDIDEERARRHSLAGVHTIWELALHITTWLRIARERLSATQALDATPEEDWPPMAGAWEDAKSSLAGEMRAVEQAILKFPEERLREPAPAREPQSFYELLHGVIQHTAYHAGQIALLKKAM